MAEITSYCAAGCAHCFAGSDKSATRALPKETLFDLIDFAREIDARMFAFTGGDALSHPDWEEAVAYAREKGLETGLGWYLDELGVRPIGLLALKGVGFGHRHRDWEPTLQEYF